MASRLSNVVAVDPPANGPTEDSIFWREAVAMMKANPVWHNLGPMSPGTMTRIKQGCYPAFCPDGMDRLDRVDYVAEHWEIKTSTIKGDQKKRSIFARFLGE